MSIFSRFSNSLTLRFSLFYGLLGLFIILFLLGFIYIQVIGALHAQQFRQISTLSNRVVKVYEAQGRLAVIDYLDNELQTLYPDLWLLVDENNNKIIGNIDNFPEALVNSDYISDLVIYIYDEPLEAKLKRIALGSDTLLVGKNLNDINDFKYLMVRASFIAIILGVLFIWLSAYWFRMDLDASVGVIRKTAQHIRSKKLKMRIPVEDADDELNLLIKELNLMLDYLEHSLAGVRYVSDTITHNIRTPITRITSYLYPLSADPSLPEETRFKVEQALTEIKELVQLFDKLVQISELEMGVYRQSLYTVDLSELIDDLSTLYVPYADECGLTLEIITIPAVKVHGDKDLLASALSNLLENACKYTKHNIQLHLSIQEEKALITIEDDGIGVEDASLSRLGTHFYRDQRALRFPGTGLGLASVLAIVQYQEGQCTFYHAPAGGLGVKILLPLS